MSSNKKSKKVKEELELEEETVKKNKKKDKEKDKESSKKPKKKMTTAQRNKIVMQIAAWLFAIIMILGVLASIFAPLLYS